MQLRGGINVHFPTGRIVTTPPLMEATHFQPARAALTFTFSTFFTSFVSRFFALFSVPSLFPYVLCRGAFLTTLFFPRAQSGHLLHIPPPPTGSLRQTSMDLFRCKDMKVPHFGQSFGLCQDEFVRLCPAVQHHCSQWGGNQSRKYRG